MGTEGEVAVGVDLGHTNSAVAFYSDDSVEVLSNDIDKRTTPSCVYIKDSERQVGEAALRLAASYPANTIRNVKSILGRPNVPKKRNLLGAVEMKSSESGKAIVLKIKNTNNEATLFSPEEIASMLLLELKKSAELQLQRQVSKAVVAVPSYFNAAQRRAVMDAAYLAGLHVPHLLNETTAAALAYAHDREEEKTVVIVDVGGGGSAVAVVKVALNEVQVLAHSGARLPGGEDFDATMMEYLKKAVKEKLALEVTDPRDTEILRSQWAKAKEKLSRIPQATISVFLPGVGAEFLCDLKRSDFELTCADHFKKIADGLLKTLILAKVKSDDLDEVLLVGGSSRIPHLRSIVQVACSDRQLCKAINPDEAVAKGAALLAANVVKLKPEVLSLKTVFRIGQKVYEAQANQTLPCHCRVDDPVIEIQQELAPHFKTTIFKGRLMPACRVAVCVSGLVKFMDFHKDEVEYSCDGCLPVAFRKMLLKKMQTHREREAAESRRMEAKNALEDFLRNVRASEIPDDQFHDDAVKLRTECEKRLQWLNENGDKEFHEYDYIRTELVGDLDALNTRREAENARLAAKERLRVKLQDIASAEIPDDSVHERAMKLKQRCEAKLGCFSSCPDVSIEEYTAMLNRLSSQCDELETDRRRHASDQRKRESRRAFDSKIADVFQYIEENAHRTAFEPYRALFVDLCKAESEWLHSSTCSKADETELFERRQSFERKVAKLRGQFIAALERAENAKTEAYKSAEVKILEALHIEVPPGDESLQKYAEAFSRDQMENLAWLQKNQDREKKDYDKLTDSVSSEISLLQEKVAAAVERSELICALKDAQTRGQQSFSKDPLLMKAEKRIREMLTAVPQTSTESLKQTLSSVNTVLSKLEEERRHRLNQEQEARRAADAHRAADDAFRSMPPCPGLPSVQQAQQHVSRATWTPAAPSASSGQASYQPHENTERASDAMEVDSGEHVLIGTVETNGLCNKREDTPVTAASRLKTLYEQKKAHRPCSTTSQQHTTDLDNVSAQVQVDLQSRAKEIMLEVLKGARAAGCMALLVDLQVEDEHDLLSLSLRFLQDSGDVVERLLLVEDVRRFSGSLEEFVLHIWARFESLCREVALDWRHTVNFVSARDCGPIGPAFVKLLKENGLRDFRVVISTSVPLDKRVVLDCKDRSVPDASRREIDVLVNFFAFVDILRRTQPCVCQCLDGQLGRPCTHNPWKDYISSIAFLRRNVGKFASMLQCSSGFDPKNGKDIESIKKSMNITQFLVCLATIDEVFSKMHESSQLESIYDFKGYWDGLSECAHAFASSDYQNTVSGKLRIADVTVTPRAEISSLVRVIIKAARSVVCDARNNFKHCYTVLQSVSSQGDKLRDPIIGEDLLLFRKQYPNVTLDTPHRVLRTMRRSEFRRKFPVLYHALQRALTTPLLPPASRRSSELLRDSLRRAATVSQHITGASVLVASTLLDDAADP